MSANMLKLNESKTELMIYNSKQRLPTTLGHLASISFSGHTIPVSTSARNLGVTYDRSLTFEAHVNNIVRSANYHLRTLSRMRKFLTADTTKTFVQAVIMSRLDYCNSLLNGLPESMLQRLQKVQNSAARLITRSSRHDHITPVLKSLHWLPVKARIRFKILLLAFKILNNLAPAYLNNILVPYRPARALRSGDQNLLTVPKTNLANYGDRSFQRTAPLLWNALPSDLRANMTLVTFKHKLKTHLFNESYNC